MHWVSDLLDAAIAGRGDNYAAFMCQQLNAKNIELSEKVDLEIRTENRSDLAFGLCCFWFGNML